MRKIFTLIIIILFSLDSALTLNAQQKNKPVEKKEEEKREDRKVIKDIRPEVKVNKPPVIKQSPQEIKEIKTEPLPQKKK
jgi:hypothetical protein